MMLPCFLFTTYAFPEFVRSTFISFERLLVIFELAKSMLDRVHTSTFRCQTGWRSIRSTTLCGETSTRRPGRSDITALRDSGSSRSFPQRSDGWQARTSDDYITLGGRKSVAPSPLSCTRLIPNHPLSLSLFSQATVTTTISSSRSLPPSPPSDALHLHQRSSRPPSLLTSTTDCLQTNPPTFPVAAYDRERLGCPGSEEHWNERWNELIEYTEEWQCRRFSC